MAACQQCQGAREIPCVGCDAQGCQECRPGRETPQWIRTGYRICPRCGGTGEEPAE